MHNKYSSIVLVVSTLNKGARMKTTTINTNTKKANNVKTILIVSIVWIAIGTTIVGYLQNGQAQYNRGVFDGMQKTKQILSK